MDGDPYVLVVLATERVFVPSPIPFLVFFFLAACGCALLPSRSPGYVVQRV